MADDHLRLAALLGEAEHAGVLTGAGISTESGIPDFRSAGGLWETYDPMKVASMTTFMDDPSLFWRFHRPRIDILGAVEPNAAHRAVAHLQQRGIVKADRPSLRMSAHPTDPEGGTVPPPGDSPRGEGLSPGCGG
jgi:NAD-dependent deacetylase